MKGPVGRQLNTTIVLFTIALGLGQQVGAEQQWEWQHPYPVGHTLHDIWGSGPTDIYAVGNAGTIVHFDGGSWNVLDRLTKEKLNGVWGSGPKDVFVVGQQGTLLHFDGRNWANVSTDTKHLLDVWGSSKKDVYAISERSILHFDGASWSSIEIDGPSNTKIWGVSRKDVYVIGEGGTVRHFDGSEWTMMSREAWGYGGVLGRSQEGFFSEEIVRGEASFSSMFHYDGRSWTPFPLPKIAHSQMTTHMWGAGPDNAFVQVQNMRDSGSWTLHFNGSEWVKVADCPGIFREVWSAGPRDVYAVGKRGIIMHFDGTAWHEISRNVVAWNAKFNSVWGTGPDDVYAFGYVEQDALIAHYDGENWAIVYGQEADREHRQKKGEIRYRRPRPRINLTHGWGSGPDNIYAVGNAGSVLHFGGDDWSPIEIGTKEDLKGVWGSAADDIYVVGAKGTAVHYDGASWTKFDAGDQHDFVSVWGSGPNDVYILRGNWCVQHWDGTEWGEMCLPEYPYQMYSTSIWGSGANDVFVVGHSARIGHFDGSSWTLMPLTDDYAPYLASVGGNGPADVIAVGRDTKMNIFHFDGESWSPVDAREDGDLSAVWGDGNGGAFAVGEAIRRFDPTREDPSGLEVDGKTKFDLPWRGRPIILLALLAVAFVAVLVFIVRKRG